MFCRPRTAIRVAEKISSPIANSLAEARKFVGYAPEVDEAKTLVEALSRANEAWTALALKLDEIDEIERDSVPTLRPLYGLSTPTEILV